MFQPMRRGELAAFCAGAEEPDGLCERLARSLELGSVRPEWCWLATRRDGTVLARHYWWGLPGSPTPIVYKPVSAEDPGAALDLLVHGRDQIGVQEAWCDVIAPVEGGQHPSVARADLVALVTGAGFEFAVGRVGVLWTPEAGIPRAAGTLTMRPALEFDDERLAGLFRAVGDGSADHGMILDRRRLGADREARKRLSFARGFRGEPDWFAVGLTPAGELAGYVVPAYDSTTAQVAELGVAAPHRGRGYAAELLAYATGLLAAAGARRISADTDLANTRMRAAFARAGYRESHLRDDYAWRRDDKQGLALPASAAPGPAPSGSAARSPAAPSPGVPGSADRGGPVPAFQGLPPTLETARLRLTPLTVGDAAEMTGVLSDPRLYEFIGGAPPTLADLQRQYEHQTAGGSPDGSEIWHNWITRTAPDGGAVGFLQATIAADGARAEVAWVIGAAHQRGGFASEAAATVVGWLRRTGVREVMAHIHPGNVPSQIVARRTGLLPTGVIHNGEVRWQRRFGPIPPLGEPGR